MFEDRDSLARSPAHAVALDCLAAGIRAADPEAATASALSRDGNRLSLTSDRETELDLAAFDRVLVLGGGKAAAGVVRALDAALGDRIPDGLIVVPEDSPEAGTTIGEIELAGGGHPVPTDAGVAATRRMLDLAAAADERTLVVAVVTGGGSALLTAPAGDLSIDSLREATRELLDAGAEISEINAVRTQLSDVKGGRLAAACAPATVLGIVVSDVVGDPLSVVASGPTAPDERTPETALSVLDRYEVDVPTVREHLDAAASAGGDGERVETSTDARSFSRVHNHIVASNRTAVDAAAQAAEKRGFTPCVLSTRVRGSAAGAAPTHVAIAEEVAASGDPVEPPAVLLSGGETTVDTGDVAEPGVGGPNLEFGLAAALELAGDSGTVVAALDTDGHDGSTDAAGAMVDGETVGETAQARNALARHDSLPYLNARNAVLRTGATGTNVDDLRVLVIPHES